MAFWSGERLEDELSTGNLIVPFNSKCLDCASYQLTVGEQVFATSDRFVNSKPSDPVIQVLGPAPNHTLRIAPGQFAFLLTEEVVKVPSDAIALISMRARYKLQGLINVSGFHVDPGWVGKLLFSVYNAGPAEVLVQRGQEMFLILYADLDKDSTKVYKGKSLNQNSINPDLVSGMGTQVFSPLMLQRKIDDLTTKIEQVDRAVSQSKNIWFGLGTFLGLVIGAVAVFATFVPATLGLLFGSILQAGGYELKMKTVDQSQSLQEAIQPVDVPKAPASQEQRAIKPPNSSKER